MWLACFASRLDRIEPEFRSSSSICPMGEGPTSSIAPIRAPRLLAQLHGRGEFLSIFREIVLRQHLLVDELAEGRQSERAENFVLAAEPKLAPMLQKCLVASHRMRAVLLRT